MNRVLPLALPLSLAFLAGCPGGGPDDLPRGCITVEGDGDFASISEAVAAATAGQTIALCEAQFDETVIIEKDLVIEGSGDRDSYVSGAVNDEAFRVADGVEVTFARLGILSTRSGITAENATVHLDRVGFWGVGNYGVEAAESVVTASEVEVDDAGWGGFYLEGGSLELVDSEITGRGNGVFVEGGTSYLARNTISGIFPTQDQDLSEGGWGVWIDGGSADFEGNTFSENAADVYVEGAGATIAMTGDKLGGSYYGVWFESTSGTLTDVTIDGYLQYGIIQNGGPSLELTNVAITTDPEISAVQEAEDYDGFSGSVGIIAFAADLTIVDSVVSGNNGGGIYQADEVGPVKFDVDGLVVDGNARYGIVTARAEATFKDLVISNTVDHDASCVQLVGTYNSYSCNAGLWSAYSQVDWNGGSLENGGAMGATVIANSIAFTDVTLDHPGNFGVWGIGAAVTADGLTFEAPAEAGFYLMDDAVGVIRNSTFRNGSFAAEYEATDDTGLVTTYKYYYYGQDVQVWSSTVIVENSTFENGENGINVYDGAAEVIGSKWDGYNAEPLAATFDAALVVTDSTFSNIGNDAIRCYSGVVELDGVTIAGVTEQDVKSEIYEDGALIEEQSYEYTMVGEAIELYECDFLADGLTIKTSSGPAIYGMDSAFEMDGATITDVSTYDGAYDAGMYVMWVGEFPQFLLTDARIAGVPTGDGLRLTGIGGSQGFVAIDGVTIGSTVDGASGVGLNGLLLRNVGGSTTISDFEVDGAGKDGIRLEGTPALVELGSVAGVGGDGVYVSGGIVEIADVAVEQAVGSAVHLADSQTHTVRDSTLAASEYALECDNAAPATVTDCATNTLDGTLGDVLGCGGCALPDTGPTDTGAPADSGTGG